MKTVTYSENWPESWKYCYKYDLLEIYGSKSIPGYRYAYHNRANAALQLVSEYLPVNGSTKILDVAGAQGNFSLKLAEKGYEVTWNDLREDLSGYVALKREVGEIKYRPGNVFDLGESNYFDAVLITEIIEHVAHPDDFLIKIKEMVKPGGYIIMSTPLGNYFLNKLPRFSDCPDPSVYESMQFKPNSDGHIFLLYEDELHTLAKQSGLEIKEIKVYNNPLTSGHIKLHYLLKILPSGFVGFIEKLTQNLPGSLRLKLHCGVAVALRKPDKVS
jgi:2-polyprenyl-3-methyl-5-hydroxy-6-metoxy-1,4-benzoquinol methylase